MTIGFIGAGNVGFTLGNYFASHNLQVVGYYSRHTEAAHKAAEMTETAVFDTIDGLLAMCDVLFLTVPDSQIPVVYGELCQHSIQGKLICHCSGALSAQDAFPDILQRGAFGYSVHPLFAVSTKDHAYKELTDVFFTLEGHPSRLHDVKNLLEQAKLTVRVIASEQKPLYHCAAAVASNLVVAVADWSIELLTQCGFSPEEAQHALTPLLLGNMAHITKDGPMLSLTGPVERGDTVTVQKHFESLPALEDRRSYALLSCRLLALAQQKHPTRSYEALRAFLRDQRKELQL